MLEYVSDHFGDITIGLATTAYVVFTYHILMSGESVRRPRARIEWGYSERQDTNSFSSVDKFGSETRRLYREMFGGDLSPQDIPTSQQRFLRLLIINKRDVLIDWAEVVVSAVLEIPHQRKQLVRDALKLPNLQLVRGASVAATVVDLGYVPTTATVAATIEEFQYGTADPDVSNTEYEGEPSINTPGILAPVGKAELVPRTGGRGP